jgi:RNA polymerase sigma-70 factor, ECF subfamily
MPPDDPRTDLELVECANRGDAAAIEAIYRRHRDWALHIAWRFTGDHDLAMDVAQEAFIYLFGKLGKGGGGLVLRAKITTLLYPAIRNTALAAKRKKRPGALSPEFEPPAAAGAALGMNPEQRERSQALWALISRLSEAHREVLLMKIVDGMEQAEIALALGIPEGTVKSRLHHALAALREKAAAGEETGEKGF